MSDLHPNGGAMPEHGPDNNAPRRDNNFENINRQSNQDSLDDGDKHIAKAGLFGTSANLVNTIVGAGIIGIPYAFRQSGWIAGLVLLCFVGYLTDKSLRIMIDLATFHPKLRNFHVTTFEKLAAFPFGGFGRGFVLLSMFVMAYGAMVAYLLIIKDTVPTLLGFDHGANAGIEREIVLVITSLIVMLPLSMQRDMANLSYTSVLSVSADVILVGFIMWYAPIAETVQAAGGFGEVILNDSVRPTLFIGLGVLSTAMACQHSAFIVSGSLESLTRARWAVVTGSSIGLATILCVTLGSAGYLGFLEDTQGDVLNNFAANSQAANVARALLAITMLFTYPMEAFVARHVFSSIFFAGDLEADQDMPPLLCGMDNGCCNRRHRLTFGIYLSTLIPALIFDDLGPVLSITGSLGGSCISYILPGLVYLGVNGEHFVDLCHEMLQDGAISGRAQVKKSSNLEGNIELPVAGDATQRVGAEDSSNGNLELPSEGQQLNMAVYSSSKPVWWYLLGYPVWYGIASTGKRGMEEMIASYDGNNDFNLHDNEVEQKEILPDPTPCDYFGAMLFILFGLVAAVAGLATNVWVIVIRN